MKRGLLALSVLSILAPLGISQGNDNPFEKEIQAFETQDRATPPVKGGILFLGSSSIRMWTTVQTDFPEAQVLNRGFGGSTIADSITFFDRIVKPYAPKMIVFFAGTNDLAAGKSADEVIRDYQTFADLVRRNLPATTVAYIGITPAPSRQKLWDAMRTVNAAVREFNAKHDWLYVDVFDKFLNDGQPRPELFQDDQLHLRPAGYAIWIDAVRPILKSVQPER